MGLSLVTDPNLRLNLVPEIGTVLVNIPVLMVIVIVTVIPMRVVISKNRPVLLADDPGMISIFLRSRAIHGIDFQNLDHVEEQTVAAVNSPCNAKHVRAYALIRERIANNKFGF